MEPGQREVILEFPHKRGGTQRIVLGGPQSVSPAARLHIEGRVDGGRFLDRNIQRSGGGGLIWSERADTHIEGKFEIHNMPGSLNNSSGTLEIRVAGVESPRDVVLTLGNSGASNVLIFMQGDFPGDVALSFSGTHLAPAMRLRVTPSAVDLHAVATEGPIDDEVREEDADIKHLYDINVVFNQDSLRIQVVAKSVEPHRPASISRH